jgi:hypothetical protein
MPPDEIAVLITHHLDHRIEKFGVMIITDPCEINTAPIA